MTQLRKISRRPVAQSETMALVGMYWLAFQAVDVAVASLALAMNGDRRKYRLLPLVPIQRFTYRQLLYWVTLGALWMAIKGQFVGWSKLLRTGSVKAPAE